MSLCMQFIQEKLIPEIEKAFEKGKRSVLTPVFEMQDVVFVEVSEIRKLDPELKTFVNINTVEDIECMIEAMVENKKLGDFPVDRC